LIPLLGSPARRTRPAVSHSSPTTPHSPTEQHPQSSSRRCYPIRSDGGGSDAAWPRRGRLCGLTDRMVFDHGRRNGLVMPMHARVEFFETGCPIAPWCWLSARRSTLSRERFSPLALTDSSGMFALTVAIGGIADSICSMRDFLRMTPTRTSVRSPNTICRKPPRALPESRRAPETHSSKR